MRHRLVRRAVRTAMVPAALVVLVGVTGLLTAAAASAATTTRHLAANQPDIPSGLVLRVGDQGQNLQTLFQASGALKGAPNTVQFDQFGSGPLVDAAFAAHAIDLGTMGDTPAAATVSSHLGVKAVAVARWDGPVLVLLAKPGISSVAQLKGKNVAYTTGTAEQAFALRALAAAHLKQ